MKGEEHRVYKLRKALYGLKQAPRAWYSKIDHHFRVNGFVRSESEHTLYRKIGMSGEALLIYVDNIIYTSSPCTMLSEFRKEMMNTFKMTDLGLVSHFLGIEVRQFKSGIFIIQKNYIEGILHQMNMTHCKPTSTPMGVNDKLQDDAGELCSDPGNFRSLIGKLIYVTHTRPDICFAVNYLSRFMNQPCKNHFTAAKRVARYLAGTRELGLWYSQEDKGVLEAFSDSDWGGSVSDRKSTS